MKIALLLTGQSLGKRNSGKYQCRRTYVWKDRITATDWNLSKQSIKENLIDCFVQQGHDVKVYLTTYFNDNLIDIADFYNPQKMLVLSEKNSTQRSTYKKSLTSMLEEDVDVVISTRFDINFSVPLNSLNIDLNKMNFLSKLKNERYWIDNHFIDDCLFIIPKRYLNEFITTITHIELNCHTDLGLHPSFDPMFHQIGSNNINFMVDGLHGENEYYSLMRVCHCDLKKDCCDCWRDVFAWQRPAELCT